MFSSEAVCLPDHTVCATSAQCIIGPKRHLQLKGPFTRCKATALGVPTFYTWQCPHSTFLLCFTQFERMPGNKVDPLGVPILNVSIVFYTL